LGAGSVPATEPVTVNERGGLNDPDTRSFGVAPSAVVYTCQKYVPLARPLTFACVGAVDWSEAADRVSGPSARVVEFCCSYSTDGQDERLKDFRRPSGPLPHSPTSAVSG
jgi:hypothetical protein